MTYRAFPDGPGGLTFPNDGSAYTLGMSFYTTKAGQQAVGAALWIDPAASADNLANLGLRCNLWRVHLNQTAIDPYLAGSALFSASGVSGAWYEMAFDAPVNLDANELYCVSVTVPGNVYSALGGYFYRTEDFPAPSGADGLMLAANLKAPWNARNGSFNAGSRAVLPPNDEFNATWYGIDVLLNDTGSAPPPPTTGPRLWTGADWAPSPRHLRTDTSWT